MIHASNGKPPNDEELFAYAVDDETLNEERAQHLEHCPLCQRQLKDYQHTHKSMLSRLYRTLCPDSLQLILYCEHALPADDVFAITEHLHECLLCRGEVRDIRVEVARFTPFPEQSEADPLLKILKKGLKWLFARPITQQTTAIVLRSDSSAPLWPLQYQVGPFKLTFQVSRAQNDRMKLIGFFEELSPEQLQTLEGAEADLYQASLSDADKPELSARHGKQQQPIISTTVDDVGNFVFTAVSPGNYIVILHLPDTELVVEGLSIA